MDSLPHVVVCPGAGMGHLVPSLRLASMLAASKPCKLTVVVMRPTLSTAETAHIDTFFTTHPHITLSEFHILPRNTDDPTIDDPFFLQYDAVNRSSPFLVAHLTALSPRPSAVFSDFLLTSGISKPLAEVGIPNFTLMVTSARFFCLMLSLLDNPLVKGEDVILPGVVPILADEPPAIMYKSETGFVRLIIINAPHLRYSKGVLLNTFDHFERDTLSALQSGKILKDLAPVFPIGPLRQLEMEKGSNVVSWLDVQPSKSVIFVSFGSRVAMAKDQIEELGQGLLRSGSRFLWVIKTTIVDKEDKEDLNNLLGEEFITITRNRGLVLKNWVNQEEVLEHPSIGGFLTHGGWNTVLESAQLGVPLLSWSSGFDHRVNSAVMKDAGLGIWERRWGREGESLITADEIEDKIKELMTSDELRVSVKRVADEARKAWENGGSSSQMFNKIIDVFTKTSRNGA